MLGSGVDPDLRPSLELTDEEWTELRELNRRAFGPPETQAQTLGRLRWAGRDDIHWVARVRAYNGRLVSATHLTMRWILVNGERRFAGGIRGVMTDPDFRRQGLARTCMQRVTHMLAEERVEMGLLLSSAMAVPLYLSLGWLIWDGPVWCDQPEDKKVNYIDVIPTGRPMVWLPNGGTAAGSIDMCGLPW
jgi:GNAT superfamily N-acetyltransferase